MSKIRFVFDLDGTITSVETLPVIAKAFHVHEEMAELTRDTVAGKIPWRRSFVRRVNLLKHVPVGEIDKLLEKTPTYPDIVSFIQNNSDVCTIATGNLDCWVGGLCKKIGCDYYSSVATVSDGEVIGIKNIIDKAEVVRNQQRGVDKVVFIGDSNNDVEAMRQADVAIAYGASHMPSKYCLAAADHVVYSEKDLIVLLLDLQISL